MDIEEQGSMIWYQGSGIYEDGVKIAENFHRTTYAPDHDVSTIDNAEVKAVCQTVLTNARKTAYLTAYPPPPPPE